MRALRLSSKDVNALLRELRRAGCTIVLSGTEHVRILHPGGATLMSSATPRSWWVPRRKVRSWRRKVEEARSAATTRSGGRRWIPPAHRRKGNGY